MLELVTSGIYSSLQDLGRVGYRRFGVPVGGVMDKVSAINANRLLGNPDEALLLEMMYKGPQLVVKRDCTLAIQGCMQAKMDDRTLSQDQVFRASAGNRISFLPGSRGVFAYLGIKGGFEADLVLGSRGGIAGTDETRRLVKGDKLQASPVLEHFKPSPELLSTDLDDQCEVQVRMGPEFDQYQDLLRDMFRKPWTLANNCNRMSYQLEEMVQSGDTGIITSAVQPGTVQLTPSGRFVVLMRDCQTTGGYARVLQLTEEGIIALSQRRPGSRVMFDLIE